MGLSPDLFCHTRAPFRLNLKVTLEQKIPSLGHFVPIENRRNDLIAKFPGLEVKAKALFSQSDRFSNP